MLPEWTTNKLRMESRVIELKARSVNEKILNLGCGLGGPVEFPNFINIDKYQQSPGIHNCDMSNLAAYLKPISVVPNAIYSSHSLEHQPYREAQKSIKVWYEILAPGGQVYLAVPNLGALCELINQPGLSLEQFNWYHYCIFGYQTNPQVNWQSTDLNHPDEPGQYHLCGFTLGTLRLFFEREGFKIQELYAYDGYGTPSIWLEAKKE